MYVRALDVAPAPCVRRVKDGAYDKLQVVPDSSVKKIGVKRASDPSLFAKSADTAPDADAGAGSK